MDGKPVRVESGSVVIDVWVVPGASRSEVAGRHGDRIKVRVSAPPEGGRANKEAERLLTRLTGVPVTLVRGINSRAKVFRVTGADVPAIEEKLGLAG